MKALSIVILSIALVVACYFVSGGIYRVKSVNDFVAHRLNILSGELSICIAQEGCKEFNQSFADDDGSEMPSQYDYQSGNWPLYHFDVYRNMSAYTNMEDGQLAEAVLEKYRKESGLKVTENAFYEVIGFSQ